MINAVTPLLSELKRHQVITHTAQENELIRVNLLFNQVELNGTLKSVSLANQYLYRPTGVLKAKDKIAGYLYHLAGCASGNVNTTLFLSLNGYLEYQQLSQDDAFALLEKWVGLYTQIFTRPLPFFANAGFTYLQKRELATAEAVFSGTPFVGRSEVSDPYISLDFTTLESVADEFIALTEAYLAPIDAIITEHKYAKA
jgi:exodeoxyribonuclease V gamma subunit